MESPGGLKIGVATERQRPTAIELALRPLPAEARAPLLDSLAAAPPHALGPLDALIVATDGNGVVASTWAQPSPGKAAALWPPEWSARRPRDASRVELQMVQSAATACDAAGVVIAQVLLEQADDPRTSALASARFAEVAVLEYLGRSIGDTEIAPEPLELRFEPYRPGLHQRLKRLIEATYIDSLDCPALGQVRDLDDVLAGYRATGRFDPSRWLLATDHDGIDVGVLLLAEHPDADQTELVYLGVPPKARGLGVGSGLVRRALLEAHEIGSDHLMVAVDRENAPARRIYDSAGFARWATRHVWVRTLQSHRRTSS